MKPTWLAISDIPDEPCKREMPVEQEQADNMRAILGDKLWQALERREEDERINDEGA